MKKEALTVIAVVTLVLLVIGCTQQQQPAREKTTKTTTKAATFSCENDNGPIQKRGYILLMGLASHHKEEWVVEKNLMEQDPKAKFAVIYDQDENLHIEEISNKFLADMEELLKANPVDELVIFGSSAGGVTASYSISRLNFSGPVALHTIASPIKGYDLTGFRAAFLGNRKGFLKDIAIGFKPFDKPGKNVKAYHHKTVTDHGLKDYCGNMAAFCDVREIQNNNIEGSKEFYYPQHDHDTIMGAVIRYVLKCYNENLPSLSQPDSQGNDVTPSLGKLCRGEEECNTYCEANYGRCKEYCEGNENPLCLRIFPPESGSEEVRPEGQTETTKKDTSPVLKNLGVNIELWNKETNLAGDLTFSKQLLFDDGHIMNEWVFIEFGGTGQRKMDPIGSNIEYWFFVPLGTNVYAPIDGTVQIGFFEHTQDWGISFYPEEGSNWIVSFEHVVDLAVKDGDRVNAGDIVAKAAPRINKEIAMVELAVWTGGTRILKYCPFEFLDDSLKPIYEEKINQLAKDWEEFIGKDVYKQEDWVAPGCLLHNITER